MLRPFVIIKGFLIGAALAFLSWRIRLGMAGDGGLGWADHVGEVEYAGLAFAPSCII